MSEWITSANCYKASLPVKFSTYAAFIYRAWPSMGARDTMPCIQERYGSDGEMLSSDVIVIGEEGNYVLAGALSAFRSITLLRAVWRGARFVEIQVEQPSIAPDECPEEMLVLRGSDWRELLFQYADASAAKNGRIMPDVSKNITGYCTWYYYYKEVTGKDLMDNIDALAKNRDPYAAEYVQIDDGYQNMQGDWLERNDNWPFTLKSAADKIIASGMKPGIWIMPFVASTASNVYKEHPDWFVMDPMTGKPVERGGWSPAPDNKWCCLDATIPEVREHIQHVFRAFADMGYSYFKLDGLNYGLTDGKRRDPKATSVSAFRTLVKAIREAVPESMLMACGGNYLVCLGLFDNARASCDTSRYYVKPYFDNQNFPMLECAISDAAHLTMNNFWRFDRWFRMDPDSLMARQDNAFYTFGEARISVLTGIMTGVSITSDNLATISAERNKLLATAQRYRMRDARPFKYNLAQWPQFFEGTVDGKRAVAVFNDSENIMNCNFAELGLAERCQELLRDAEYSSGMELNAHDAALFIAK